MPSKTTPLKNVEFIEVDPTEVPEGRAGRGQLSPASKALLEGKTIWIPGKNRATRFSKMARSRGYQVRTRAGARDGVAGTYVWLVPLDEEKNGE